MTHSDYVKVYESKVGRPSFKRKIAVKIFAFVFYVLATFIVIKLYNYLSGENFGSIAKNNATVLNVILTSILIIVTVVYVVYTGIYVKTTNKILKETILNRTLQYRPTFFINFFGVNVSEREHLGKDRGNMKINMVTFDISIENYSKSFAYNPSITLHFPCQRNDKVWDVVQTIIELDGKIKLAPETTIEPSALLPIDSLDFNSLPQPALHFELIYEDGERNLFSNSLFMLLKQQAVDDGQKKFMIKIVKEEIYVLRNDLRANVFDRVVQVFSFDYQKAEKVFSRYEPPF